MSQSVSVAMAVYNGLPYLPAQLASVLSQLQPDDEVVIVDDQSSDGSFDWLKALSDSRVRLLRNECNRGVRLSFERALNECRAPIVFLCDQDDLWLPGKRDAITRAFEADPLCTVVVTDAQVIDARGLEIIPSFMATRGGFRGSWWSTLIRNRYLGCCMALRRDIVELGLPIPPTAPMHDMWFGLLGACRGRVRFLEQPYLQYRRHGRNVSPSKHAGLGQMLQWRWNLARAIRVRLHQRPLGSVNIGGTSDGAA